MTENVINFHVNMTVFLAVYVTGWATWLGDQIKRNNQVWATWLGDHNKRELILIGLGNLVG